MINSEDFTIRLQKIMEFHGLSASAFADKIGVQRSSISHILSGRNKPSLEFVMKVLSSFQDVDLYWLLNGKGSFPIVSNQTEIKKDLPEKVAVSMPKSLKTSEIDRIVIFYNDGSFKNYSNS
ncbi:MAG: helix-turn-helix transcriptional regulator [Bacteroidia bacterium]|nr:helix-turn-helix transcriptional regulator [Bacteroidia bacterium]